ncbi:hypothetical protein HMPREF1868_01005 [Olsenella sp. DNF00959]|nr:hypothetical protein HMPREF1868_01005 [Olsenella sp. DNF00959]
MGAFPESGAFPVSGDSSEHAVAHVPGGEHAVAHSGPSRQQRKREAICAQARAG